MATVARPAPRRRAVLSPPAEAPRGGTRRDLRAMTADGAIFSVMVGIGETYLPAFVLAAGMGELAAGLVATLPMVAGALLQLVSPAAIRWLGSHRRWVVLCAACQAMAFLPLAAAAWTGGISAWLVFGMAALYWGAGMAAGPAWNSWAATLVPGAMRAGYFAHRTRFSQLGVLMGFLTGGFTLQYFAGTSRAITAFVALFLTASICRLISAALLASQSEPSPPGNKHRGVSLTELLGPHRSDGALLIYFFAVQTAAQIAGPFFTPYMLKHIRFSYYEYVALIATSYATKAVALPALGRLARRIGTPQLLWIGGLAIAPVSAFWLVSNAFGYLLLVQVAAGLAWAGYELAICLLFFEAIGDDERTSVLTTYNAGNAVATALGALLGGGILRLVGEAPATYLFIFGLSSVARLAAMLCLLRVPRAVPSTVS
ncbi:MAG TPA: MFS transporter [Pirellulales bacterium]